MKHYRFNAAIDTLTQNYLFLYIQNIAKVKHIKVSIVET